MAGLLGHVVSLLTTQRENAATEALSYVLSSNTARGALASLLSGGHGSPVAVARIRTQASVGEESRPDVVVYADDDRPGGFIEAKLWAGLTDAQPVEYLRRLEEQGGQVLLFLVPKERIEPILMELSARARAKSVALSDWSHAGSLRVARTPTGKSLIVSSWASVLGALRLALAQANENDALADIDQLEALVDRFATEGFIPLSASELSDLEVPRRIVSLIDVVDRGVLAAVAAGHLKRDGLKETPGRYSAGRYVAFPQAICWMGVDMAAWRHLQVSPAWIFFYGTQCAVASIREALQPWARATGTGLHSFRSADIAIPLRVRIGADEDAVVADFVAQIRSVGAALATAGIPAR